MCARCLALIDGPATGNNLQFPNGIIGFSGGGGMVNSNAEMRGGAGGGNATSNRPNTAVGQPDVQDFTISQTDESFFGFGNADKFDGITPAQYDAQIDNLISGLLDAINFSLRESSRRSYTKGGAFLNNKRQFPDFWNRSLSTVTDPGNDALRTIMIDHVLADASFTIGAAVITSESIDGLVESLQQHSRIIQAPIFVSTSTVDRIRGGIKKVRILETFRITGDEGGSGTCVNTVTGAGCQ